MYNNALVNHKYKFVLFWNGKCACTTLKKFFVKSINDTNGFNIKEKDLHLYIMKYYLENEINKKEILNSFKKIIVVRNPFSRLVSFYTNKFIINNQPIIIDKREPPINPKKYSFNELISLLIKIPFSCLEHHLIPQSWQKDNLKFNYVIKMENMKKEMESFLKNNKIDVEFNFGEKIGGHDTKYDNNNNKKCYDMKPDEFNKNNIPEYQYFYNKALIDEVLRYYEKDFKKFNYSTNLLLI